MVSEGSDGDEAMVRKPVPGAAGVGSGSRAISMGPPRLTVLREQQLVAANAQIGVAKADYFPQISLTASGGYQSSALTGLFSGPAGLWTFGGSAIQPVFEGGRIRNQVRFAEARTREATLLYQRSVQQAFRDVSDALVGYRKSQEFRIQQEQLTHSAEEATTLSTMRYKGGATSYLEVLDSDTRYFAAGLVLAMSPAGEMWSVVTLSPNKARQRAPETSVTGLGVMVMPSK